MKKFTVPAIVAIALCVIALFSLDAFATKGPCVGGGSETFGPTETIDGDTKAVVTYTVYFDQSCADMNENDCTATYVSTATRTSTTTTTYKKGLTPSGWVLVGVVTTVDKGRKVC